MRADLGLFPAVLLGLALFGTLYNQLVSHLEKKGYSEGFVSLLVAAGSGVTLLGMAVLDWQAALLALVCFMASGSPMILGSILRYVQAREQSKQRLIREIRRDDPTA